MAPKRKGKKKCKDLEKEKQCKYESLLRALDVEVEDAIDDLNLDAEFAAKEIEAKYFLALQAIPNRFHDMTFVEMEELERKKTPPESQVSSTNYVSAISSCVSRVKSMSEQRKLSAHPKKNATFLKSQMSKKSESTALMPKNISTNNNCRLPNRKALGLVQPMATPGVTSSTSNDYRKGSSSSTFGHKRPIALNQKRPVNPRQASLTITPKFNPRAPLPNSALLRKPKAGEVIMSLSGSPLQNPVPANLNKPALLSLLANGKVFNMAEAKQLGNLDTLTVDQQTMATLQEVQQKLAGILRA